MTHILALSSYLQSPIEAFLRGCHNVLVSIQESRMRVALSYVRSEMMHRKEYRDTYNALAKLSDKQLRDIGITRGEIHSIAMESFLDNR